ncbi:N-acetylglucosaminyl-phosphatidylinositol de-N-acetylase [Apiospora arundinis]
MIPSFYDPKLWFIVNQEKHSTYGSDIDLYQTGKYSDIKVRCEDRTWNLHRAVICQRCPYFEKAFSGPFIEAQNAELVLEDFSKDDVEIALIYLYARIVPASLRKATFRESYRIFLVADYLGIEGLQQLVAEVLADSLKSLRVTVEAEVMVSKLLETNIAPELREVLAEETIDVLEEIAERANQPATEAFKMLKQPLDDFVDFVSFVLGFGETGSVLSYPISKNPMVFFDILRIMIRG